MKSETKKIKLLVSAFDLEEARACAEAGVDIIDIKNPAEGSLGANFPWVINGIIKEIGDEIKKRRVKLSAATGDLDFAPGSASLAALALAEMGVDYIKAGIKVNDMQKAEKLCMQIKKAIDYGDYNNYSTRKPLLVLASYADFYEIESISPIDLIEIAEKIEACGVMIDTYNKKSRKNIFDFLDEGYVKRFVKEANKRDLITALAGRLNFDAVERIKGFEKESMPHIIGIRSLACSNGDRNKSIEKRKIIEIKGYLEN